MTENNFENLKEIRPQESSYISFAIQIVIKGACSIKIISCETLHENIKLILISYLKKNNEIFL